MLTNAVIISWSTVAHKITFQEPNGTTKAASGKHTGDHFVSSVPGYNSEERNYHIHYYQQ